MSQCFLLLPVRYTVVHVYGVSYREEKRCAREICIALKQLRVMSREYVYEEGTLGRAMYIIEVGEVEIRRFEMVIGVLEEGAFFGEQAIGTRKHVWARSARAVTDCVLAFLTNLDMQRIAKEHPEVYNSFAKVAQRRTRLQADRMQDLLLDAAQNLGVPPGSETMNQMLSFVKIVQKDKLGEDAAATEVQRVYRGWRDRVALSRRATEGTNAHDLETGGEEAVVNAALRKEAAKISHSLELDKVLGQTNDHRQETMN